MKAKRVAKWLVRILLFVLLADVVFVFAFPKSSLPPAGERADVIVVLGAAPNSPAIRFRALKGYELYNAGHAPQLILAGGVTSVQDESEARNMNRFLLKQGLGGNVILEEKSTNTLENLRNSKQLVPGATSVLVVSDTYHLPRAFLVAKAVGFSRVFWSAPAHSYYKPTELTWYYGRELVALLAYVPKLIFMRVSAQ